MNEQPVKFLARFWRQVVPLVNIGASHTHELCCDLCFTVSVINKQTNKQTPRSSVLPEKLAVPQVVEKFPALTEPEGSLPHSQAASASFVLAYVNWSN